MSIKIIVSILLELYLIVCFFSLSTELRTFFKLNIFYSLFVFLPENTESKMIEIKEITENVVWAVAL